MNDDGRVTMWKRVLLGATAAVVLAAVAGAVYLWHIWPSATVNSNLPPTNTVPLTPQQEQKKIINSLTAPAPVAASSTSAQTNGSGAAPPKPPSSLSAPAAAPNSAAKQQQEKATINSLTAPQ